MGTREVMCHDQSAHGLGTESSSQRSSGMISDSSFSCQAVRNDPSAKLGQEVVSQGRGAVVRSSLSELLLALVSPERVKVNSIRHVSTRQGRFRLFLVGSARSSPLLPGHPKVQRVPLA
jgi:hypothetical protein